MESLRQSLETYYADVVEAIAVANGIPQAEERLKSELVAQLVNLIPRQAKDADTVADLSEEAQAALAVMLENGGQASPSELALPLALAGLIRLEDAEFGSDAQPTLQEVLEPLLLQGLVVNLTPPPDRATRRRFAPLREIGIPPEVVRVLSHVDLPKPEPRSDLSLMEPPARVEQRPLSDLLRTLFFIWAELRREPASALKAGGIYKRDARRLAKSMGRSFSENEDEIRFLVDVLLEMGLLVETVDEVYAHESEDRVGFWEQPVAVRVKQFLSAILDIQPEITFDLSPLHVVRTYVYYMISPRPIDMLYADMMEILGRLTENVWFPLDAFLTLLNGGKPGTFILDQQSVTDLYQRLRWAGVRNRASGQATQLEQALRQVDRRGLVRILSYFKELGVMMLGYADDDGGMPTALRLTPLAHAALTGQPYEDIGDQVGQIILQPDFQLLAMGPVPLQTLARMEHIAERTKVQPASVSYRITRESVYRALQADEALSSLLRFLTEATEMPVPQNVERTLREWGAQHERIVVRQPVLLLQVDRPERLQALIQDKDLGDILHPLDETTAWVPSRSALQVEQRLWELEMLPALSQGPDADLPHSLTWEGDGRLKARYPLPSLYVGGSVRRFAEKDDEDWRLTPESVRAAVSAGFEVPEIIELLERMADVTLSPEWEKRLKAWGGHYGEAQTAEVRLLRFEAHETLAELRKADRRLRRYLHPLEKRDGVLVVVEAKRWDDVQVLLEEWGVAVEENTLW